MTAALEKPSCCVPRARKDDASWRSGRIYRHPTGVTDLPKNDVTSPLVRLVRLPPPDRLRLSSIDPAEVDDSLLDLIAEEPRLMPHLHLSLQAGDDLILKRMKRRHRRGQAIEFCQQVRRLRPEVVFGADLIAGFPTETAAQFQRSLDLIDECGLSHLHVFRFSPREGTPAARMPQVARATAKQRARRLRERGAAALVAWPARPPGLDLIRTPSRAPIRSRFDPYTAPIRFKFRFDSAFETRFVPDLRQPIVL